MSIWGETYDDCQPDFTSKSSQNQEAGAGTGVIRQKASDESVIELRTETDRNKMRQYLRRSRQGGAIRCLWATDGP